MTERLSDEREASPGLRALVQRFCDATDEDIQSATVAELVAMCELECNCEHESAVEAEIENQRLRSLLSEALPRFTETARWVSAVNKALGRPDPTGAADLETARFEARRRTIWKLESRQRLLATAEALWQLLDDIDTLGDSMHPELTPYFTAVQARVARRFEHFQSDGQTLTLVEKNP